MRQDGDLTALAYRLGRSPDALRLHAQQLGLYRPSARRRWAEWEDAVIRDGYTSALPYSEIARQLPHRSAMSLAARARKLDLITYARRWSIHDDQRLVQLTDRGSTLEDIAQRLGRTPEAIRRHASRLGINPPEPAPAPRHVRRWTGEEDELLRLHHALNPAASPSCSDARTRPSADDYARLDCVPVPSAPRIIRGTAGSPRPPRPALRQISRSAIGPRGWADLSRPPPEGCCPGRGTMRMYGSGCSQPSG